MHGMKKQMAMSTSNLRRLSEWEVLAWRTPAMPSSRIARQKQAAGNAMFAPITNLDTAERGVLDARVLKNSTDTRTDVAPN